MRMGQFSEGYRRLRAYSYTPVGRLVSRAFAIRSGVYAGVDTD